MTALTANGVLGDPTEASSDKGAAYLDALADFLVAKLRDAAAPTT
jgi:creatinine amidohydrolase/Fe(II)-dependent formamide hydrolase-like protein